MCVYILDYLLAGTGADTCSEDTSNSVGMETQGTLISI